MPACVNRIERSQQRGYVYASAIASDKVFMDFNSYGDSQIYLLVLM